MKSREELEESVKTVQAFSLNNLRAGAQILMLHTNEKFSEESFNKLYKNMEESMSSPVEKVKEYIDSLKKIRIECMNNEESKNYVIEQAGQMVEMGAHRDFAKDHMSTDKNNGRSR